MKDHRRLDWTMNTMEEASFTIRPVVVAGLWAAAVYGACGALFAAAFQWRGLRRLDPAAAASSWGFRAIITPGIILLWPWLAWRWGRGNASPLPAREVDAIKGDAAGRLRSMHGWAWKALAVVAPLILAVGIAYRSRPVASHDWPWAPRMELRDR
jgi:hypothetical protein